MSAYGERSLDPVLRVADVRALEARFPDVPLMERAGTAAAEVARSLALDRARPIVVLAGPGNNGGDGVVVARLLQEAFFDVAVVFRDDVAKLPADASLAYARFAAGGGTLLQAPPANCPGLIVDALFGIGLQRALAPRHAELVEWANRQDAPTLALDVPTGLNADTGIARAPAIRADATATFFALKPGHLMAEGPDLCGVVSVLTLEVEVESDASLQGHALTWSRLAAAVPGPLRRHERNANKGTFGTLAIIGGADGMFGATLIAGRAALRGGTGKVRIGALATTRPAVDFSMPELMIDDASTALAEIADALVIGCGLGQSEQAIAVLQQALGIGVPIVLDADALNLLAQDAKLRAFVRKRDAITIATPHPGEAARLLSTSVAGVQHDRLAAAFSIARDLRAHVVLKGAGSVLAHPDGSFDINASGNPVLAIAGSGDALAGLIGAMLAQGLPAKDALRYAVCVHGAAADELVKRGVGPVGVSTDEIVVAARDLINLASRGAK